MSKFNLKTTDIMQLDTWICYVSVSKNLGLWNFKNRDLAWILGCILSASFLCTCNGSLWYVLPDEFPHRTDKGQTLKASYVHTINPLNGNEVGVEMIHRFSTEENSFSIGSGHRIDPLTVVKAKFFNHGKFAMLCQREWRPKSFVTVSAEYDSKSINAAPKLGLALALKP